MLWFPISWCEAPAVLPARCSEPALNTKTVHFLVIFSSGACKYACGVFYNTEECLSSPYEIRSHAPHFAHRIVMQRDE